MSKADPYEHLLVEYPRRSVAVVTFNRPERLNALSSQTRNELVMALGELGLNPDVGAIVLTGAGDKAFAAGQDLSEAQTFDPDMIDSWIDDWGRVYSAVLDLEKPIVAAVNGYAVGAAFQIALVCDLRIAADHARFGMPEIDDAIPCITGTWTLDSVIGRGRITDLILTGRMLDAGEALSWGIVSAVVPARDLLEVALARAAMLAAKPRLAMRLNKALFRNLMLSTFPTFEQYAKQAHADAYRSGEPARVMAEFLARKREGRSS